MGTEERQKPRGRVGMLVDGKWRIDERLGVGGMATVYAATHRNGNRVALKWLHTEMCEDADVRDRFLREGYLVNKVNHHGVVRVLDDFTTDEGAAVLVMDLLRGETLHDHYRRAGSLAPLEAGRIVVDVLDVVVAAHEAGIVHRDLKPANVFILENGDVKVLDFGIARFRSASFVGHGTQTGTALGTPAFMPPEQACGDTNMVDERSDVWAIGAILFTLLTGQQVHVASSPHEELLAAASRKARLVADVNPTVPTPIARVVDRALAYAREDRWPNARAMQEALLQAMRTAISPSSPTAAFAQPPAATSLFGSPVDAAPLTSQAVTALTPAPLRPSPSEPQGLPRPSMGTDPSVPALVAASPLALPVASATSTGDVRAATPRRVALVAAFAAVAVLGTAIGATALGGRGGGQRGIVQNAPTAPSAAASASVAGPLPSAVEATPMTEANPADAGLKNADEGSSRVKPSLHPSATVVRPKASGSWLDRRN